MENTTFILILAGLLMGGVCGSLLSYLDRCTSPSGTCLLAGRPRRGGVLGAAAGMIFVLSVISPLLAGGGDRTQTPDPNKGIQAAGVATPTPPVSGGNKTAYNIVPITSEEEFGQLVLRSHHPVLVDFYSDNCAPCRVLSPTIERLAKEYQGRATVYMINIDTLPALVQRYHIEAVPTAIFFDAGREAKRVIGLRDHRVYTEVLDKLIGGLKLI